MNWKVLVLLFPLAAIIYGIRVQLLKFSRAGVIAHVVVFAVACAATYLLDHRFTGPAVLLLFMPFLNFRYPLFAQKQWPEQPRLTQEGKQMLADSERLHQVLELLWGRLSKIMDASPQDTLLKETGWRTSGAQATIGGAPRVWFERYLLRPFSPYWLETPLYTEEQLACARESLDADSQKLLDEALELDVKLRRMVMSEQATVLAHR